MEYDLEIKPTRLVKGQGLTKLLTESNCKALGIHAILNISASNEKIPNEEGDLQVYDKYLSSPWYKDIIYFLQTL